MVEALEGRLVGREYRVCANLLGWDLVKPPVPATGRAAGA